MLFNINGPVIGGGGEWTDITDTIGWEASIYYPAPNYTKRIALTNGSLVWIFAEFSTGGDDCSLLVSPQYPPYGADADNGSPNMAEYSTSDWTVVSAQPYTELSGDNEFGWIINGYCDAICIIYPT